MKKTIAGTVAVLAIAAAVPLIASAHGKGDGHGKPYGHSGERHEMRGHHGEGHAGRGRIRMIEMIETYDIDGDGSVSQEEIDQSRADRLRQFDADSDGQLSLEEYEALWLDAMRERMVDRFQAHDDDGDGQVTIEEFGKRTGHIVVLRDRNDDGLLNLDDTGRGRRGAQAAPAQQDTPADQGGTQPGTTQQQ